MKTDFIATTWTCKHSGFKVEVAGFSEERDRMFFAVRNGQGECMNKDSEWEDEPIPSNRDDAFIDRCRFDSFKDAVNTLERAL